ncbi:Phosphatidylserine decarboxylase proenzyme [Emticicia oligotrophica DSM 17448]|uniref:Phosphatidylserine decarboxylase proenzyme n=1 Tax=Emticicia oligotrophica (strain DSM 17448 / CIP 109782 / MTCC 6937 / GPTSA100-15) TaxID=929562 RepID=A0ABN4AM01_EMTOG|nr:MULTISPECIES: phosphatidylserine decarboxylase family protein [Emticicia]AFK03117.1 Phosphatidylserine decarboxylase proenzyme [Emticicia oligotrophica DSM 17448]
MTLHKEGTGTISLTIIGLLAANAALRYFLPEQEILHTLLLVVSMFLFVIVVQFFRKPTRVTPKNSKHVIAPADGKVVVIEEVVETEYFKGPRRQVSIFMSPLNVHINFNPISGIVSYAKYHAGKYLVAWHPKSSTENERTTIVVKHENGTEVLFRQIAGALARRICWYVKEGQAVEQGSEFGFIKFGSRIDIFLPLDAKILVNIDDKPVGGETVIAELV